jgi:hypothetical protein
LVNVSYPRTLLFYSFFGPFLICYLLYFHS